MRRSIRVVDNERETIMSGGGSTTVKQKQDPPQLPPEMRPGVEGASKYFSGIQASPPVYTGELFAQPSQAQKDIYASAPSFTKPTATQTASNKQLQGTLGGDYLLGPEAQAAIMSLAQPLFQQWRTEVQPGLRDVSQFAGQGVDSPRRRIAEDEAGQRFAQELGTSVIAPIFQSERANQMAAAQLAPQEQAASMAGTQFASGLSDQEQAQRQNELDVTYQKTFAQPVSEQMGAASTLLGTAPWGPGGGTSKSSTQLSTMEQIQGWLKILGSVAAIGGAVAT